MNSTQLENLSVKLDGLSPVTRKIAASPVSETAIYFPDPNRLEASRELASAGITSKDAPYVAALLKAETESYTPWYYE